MIVDSRGTIRSGSPKPFATSGSPACLLSARVQTISSCPLEPKVEKSNGLEIVSRLSLTANRTTASSWAVSVALKSGPARAGRGPSIRRGLLPAKVAYSLWA